jgi:hypothetical protein
MNKCLISQGCRRAEFGPTKLPEPWKNLPGKAVPEGKHMIAVCGICQLAIGHLDLEPFRLDPMITLLSDLRPISASNVIMEMVLEGKWLLIGVSEKFEPNRAREARAPMQFALFSLHTCRWRK